MIAARAALRALPAVQTAERGIRGFEHALVLPVFRASAVARFVASFPNQAKRLSPLAATAQLAANTAGAVATFVEGADAPYAAAYAVATYTEDAAPVTGIAGAAATFAARAAARATDDDARDGPALARALSTTFFPANAFAADAADAADGWFAVSIDASKIEEGMGASAVTGRKLWPEQDGIPERIRSRWSELKQNLLNTGQDWNVWTRWYEDRLAGRVRSEAHELAYVEIDEDLWKQGPAAVNAEIKRRLKELEPPPSAGQKLPEPVGNAPSAISFGWSSQGTITVVLGERNFPAFPFKGGEQDHTNRLEACRSLASDIARALESGRWNARPDYPETLQSYLAYLPAKLGEGNFLLADAQALILREMFAADADTLQIALASKLKILLQHHIGLRAYYPAVEEFYESVRKGYLAAPLPMDAIEEFIHGVRGYTPDVFEPNVAETFEAAEAPIPQIAPEAEGAPPSAQISPPPDPLGEINPEKSQQYIVASSVNDLWKVFSAGEKVSKNVEGWKGAYETLTPVVPLILDWLRTFLGG